MSHLNSPKSRTNKVSVLPALIALCCAAGCNSDDSARDYTAFIDLANQSNCADIRNRVFAIDNTLVLLDRAGSCPDASYSQVLYGASVSDVLCRRNDSIAGPQMTCPNPSYSGMFDTMVTHLTDPDLGLGPTYKVERLR